MKILRPELYSQLEDIDDFGSLLVQAKQDDTEIEEKHIKGSVCMGEELANLRFSGTLFENCRFNESNLSKTSFVNVVFKNCDFSNCTMTQGYFSRCEFITCKALGAKFVEALFKDVTIQESNFAYVNMDKASINTMKIAASTFENANLTECQLKNLECEQVLFTKTNFFKTALKGIDFTKNTITNVIVSAEGTELRGAVVDLYQAAELAKLFGVIIR